MATRTDAQLTTDANVIKNETAPGANTATRVGNMLVDAIDSKVNIDKIASPTVVGTTKLYNDFLSGNTDGAVTQFAIRNKFDEKANKAQAAWANLTYSAPYQTQNYPAKYRKSEFGEVILTGEVWTAGATTANTIIGTLPAGFRPAQEVRFALNYFFSGSRTLGLLTVETNGDVVFNGSSPQSSINLDVVRFYTD